MNDLKYNKIKTKINFNNLKFKKELGSGAFGSVYEAFNGKTTNKRMVVKKTRKTVGLQLFSLLVNGKFQGTMFDKEVDALKYLSKQGIAPKIYYSNKEKMVYVIEKLDSTLFELLEKGVFNNNNLKELTSTLKKLQKTPFIHNDLHDSNIMYSSKSKKFYVIDWGIFKLDKKCPYPKSKSKSKSKKCYEFKKSNILALENLFYYLITNKKKKFSDKNKKDFLDLFNMDNLNQAKEIINY
tara:strand:+ start:343 stop:1059 length:717 start_codon:yes stop_codon:yes gene_type:complete